MTHANIHFIIDASGHQSEGRFEEGDGPVQEEGVGRTAVGPQDQCQLCLRLHGGPGWKTALSRDLSGRSTVISSRQLGRGSILRTFVTHLNKMCQMSVIFKIELKKHCLSFHMMYHVRRYVSYKQGSTIAMARCVF